MSPNLIKFSNFFQKSKISESEALSIAREFCKEHAFPWCEPVMIKKTWKKWFITTNANCRGVNVRIEISTTTGEIIHSGISPR